MSLQIDTIKYTSLQDDQTNVNGFLRKWPSKFGEQNQ